MTPSRSNNPILLPHFRIKGDAVETLGGRPVRIASRDTRILALCDGRRSLDEIEWTAGLAKEALADALERLALDGLVALLPNRPPRAAAPARHIVVAPHVDDAALSMGGTILNLAARGEAVHVIVVFSRQSYQTALRVPPDRIDAIARAEEALAGALLGFSVSYLGLSGAQDRHALSLRRTLGCASDRIGSDPFFATDLARLETGLSAHLSEISRTVDAAATIYAPLGIGGHLDHQLVHEATRRLSAFGAASVPTLKFYEDLPYAADPRIGADIERPGADEGQSRSLPVEIEDVGSVIDHKLAALRIYRTRIRAPQIELCRRHALRLAGGRGAAERRYRAERARADPCGTRTPTAVAGAGP